MDPKAAEIEEQQKKARQKELNATHKLTSPAVATGPSSSNELKRKSGSTPNTKSAKKAKTTSTAPIAKEDKGQLNELKAKLRDTELDLKSARDRITRLEGKEESQKKACEDLKNKNDEAFDGCADLQDLKLATFNHFLAKWETVN